MRHAFLDTPLLAAVLCLSAIAQTTQTPQFTISTVAGNGTTGFAGDGGPASGAEFQDPHGLASDTAGNVYIADKFNSRVRKVAPNGVITTIAGTGVAGSSGDGGAAAKAQLSNPERLSLDASGNLYIVDIGAHNVRKVSPVGTITTVAGSGQSGYCGNGGPATSACMHGPEDAVPDSNGNLFIADFNVIWKVDIKGIITTVAGNATTGYSGDGGPATAASLNAVQGVAVSATGDLFIADQGNYRIRKVSNGIITTVVGTGQAGFSGDGGVGTNAKLALIGNLRLDAAGNLYVADSLNCRVRVVFANQVIMTVAGNGTCGYSGDGGAATNAALEPTAVDVNSSGMVYFSDTNSQRVRLLRPVAQAPAISTAGVVSASAFGGFTSVAPGSLVEIYGSNLAIDSRSWASSDFNGSAAPTILDGTSATVDGQPAFINYISPTQIDVQMPSNILSGPRPLIVTTVAGKSAAYTLTVNATEPGLLAPPSFIVGGKQYAVALFSDGSYALPIGAISGVASRPAKPGDVLVLYGVGFGPVTPTIAAGQIVQQTNSLVNNLQLSFGGMAATLNYQGLAPGYVGLYQFNVVVPNVPASNLIPVTFTLGGTPGAQTLYLPVAN